jgi:hypothetical protein
MGVFLPIVLSWQHRSDGFMIFIPRSKGENLMKSHQLADRCASSSLMTRVIIPWESF